MDRQVGLEVELGGLTEQHVGQLVIDELGGSLHSDGAQRFVARDTQLGDVEIYLDTAFRREATNRLQQLGMDAARLVVPVEIVTDPIPSDAIPRIDAICAAARQAGATGTRDGLLLGFGVHLNVSTTGDTLEDILPVLRAFALLEDLIRKQDPIDASRRLLPFVDPYPRKLVDDLASREFTDIGDLMTCYLSHHPTRNRALDMLPIFSDIDRGRVASALDDGEKLSPRPAYHFRLPDCRIDDPNWSLQREWRRWCALEAIAADTACLNDLRQAWIAHRDAWTTLRIDWADSAAKVLSDHQHPAPVL